MRAFWILLAMLICGGLAAWLMEGGEAPARTRPPTSASPPTAATAPEPEPAPPVALVEPPPPPPAAAAPPASAPPSSVQHEAVRSVDARTLRLDDRFEIIGRGTEQDPFRVGWPALQSAMDTMDASAGKLAIPPWLEPLNGSWIEISGYFAPIVKTEQASEVLFTMNRWDGCCIGLPPTVFDSIGLKLKSPVSLLGQHLIRFGTVRGELHVEPFAAGGMMLGLYRLDQGTITTQSGG